MKKCPNCGHPLKGYEIFCPNCGADLAVDQQDDHSQTSADSASDLDAYLNHLDQTLDFNSNEESDESDSDQFEPEAFSRIQSSRSHAATSAASASGEQESRSASSDDTVMAPRVNDHQGYASWWLESIRHPLVAAQSTHSSFALVSFGISLVLWILSFRTLANRLLGSILAIGFGGEVSANTVILENGVSRWWQLLILGLLAIGIDWGIGYGFCHHGSRRITLGAYGNRLAALTNVSMIIEILMLGLTLLAFYHLAMACFWIMMLIDGTGLVVSISVSDLTRAKDKTYAAIFAVILVPVVTFVIFDCILQIIY